MITNCLACGRPVDVPGSYEDESFCPTHLGICVFIVDTAAAAVCQKSETDKFRRLRLLLAHRRGLLKSKPRLI